MADDRRLGTNLGIKEQTIKKACHLAVKSHRSPEKPYLPEKSRSEAIFAFPGSWSAGDWFANGSPVAKPRAFGETKVDLGMFPCLRSISNDELATVNEAFLQKFLYIKQNSELFKEVEKAVKDKKQIIFTGHSSGGPIAVFATISLLEQQRINPADDHVHQRIFCLTFGSPLTADRICCHAVRRENWSNSFIHFVSRYDIIPRVPLSPPSSTQQLLHEVLSLLNPNGSRNSRAEPIIDVELASRFFMTVVRNVSCVASHVACTLMHGTSLLMDAISGFVELSPYRPFGVFVFCSASGKMFVVKNPDAVLQILFYSLQLGSEGEGAAVATTSLTAHFAYESELNGSLQMQDVVYFEKFMEIPLNSHEYAAGSEIKTIDAALTDLGLSSRARLLLRAAVESEKQKLENQKKIESKKDFIERAMGEVERYRSICETRGIGYYDGFKIMKSNEDFNANIKRLELVGFWDEIVEMLKRYEVPEGFESQRQWVDFGTKFRRLLEPLDIANYYRHSKNEDTGPYMIKGRPRRYRYIQRWLEHLEKRPAGSCGESTFWAEVEEFSIGAASNGSVIDDTSKILEMERNLKEWYRNGVVKKDAFLPETTLVKWWTTLPEQHRAESCIRELIDIPTST